jgi:hypothetical protein
MITSIEKEHVIILPTDKIDVIIHQIITLNEKENFIIRDVRDVLSFLSCSGHPVLLVDLSRLICQVNLSRLTYPGCPVLDVLSLLSLSWLSIMVVMPRLSGADCSVPDVLVLS